MRTRRDRILQWHRITAQVGAAQPRADQGHAIPAQKWPGHRRFFLGGAVLRPVHYRSVLRARG